MIKTLHTSSAPAAIGPYSQGKIVDGFLFASGQIAINPANGKIQLRVRPKEFAKISLRF